jgi:hypothetical protein
VINKLSLRSVAARNTAKRSTADTKMLDSRVLKSSFAPFDLAARRQSLNPQASNGQDASRHSISHGVGRGAGRSSSTRIAAREQLVQTQQREAVGLSTVLMTVLIVIGTFHALAMIMVESNRWLESRAQVARLERDITELQADMTGIATKLSYRNNEATLEQLARRQGFMYPDETRIVTVFQQN